MSSIPNDAWCDSDEFMPFPYGCLLSSSWSSLKALPKVPLIVPPHHTAMFVRLCCSYVRTDVNVWKTCSGDKSPNAGGQRVLQHLRNTSCQSPDADEAVS